MKTNKTWEPKLNNKKTKPELIDSSKMKSLHGHLVDPCWDRWLFDNKKMLIDWTWTWHENMKYSPCCWLPWPLIRCVTERNCLIWIAVQQLKLLTKFTWSDTPVDITQPSGTGNSTKGTNPRLVREEHNKATHNFTHTSLEGNSVSGCFVNMMEP
jgi:hypothetical protein